MLITVIIPAYNSEGFLSKAIDSVLAQSHQDFEILIIDDCSTDGTVALVDTYARRDRRVRRLQNPKNAGPSAARNRGIAAAKGEWIALLDADDTYHPERLEALCAAAQRNRADVVFDNLYLYNAVEGKVAGTALPIPPSPAERLIGKEEFLSQCITGRSAFDYGQFKAFIRLEFLKMHALEFPEALRHGEDFILYAKLLLAGARLLLVDTPYYYFTQRIVSKSATPSAFSRTTINFSGMRSHTLALLDHPVVREDAGLTALINKRAQAIIWHTSAARMFPFVQQRKIGGLAILCLRDWRVPILLAERTLKYLRR